MCDILRNLRVFSIYKIELGSHNNVRVNNRLEPQPFVLLKWVAIYSFITFNESSISVIKMSGEMSL